MGDKGYGCNIWSLSMLCTTALVSLKVDRNRSGLGRGALWCCVCRRRKRKTAMRRRRQRRCNSFSSFTLRLSCMTSCALQCKYAVHHSIGRMQGKTGQREEVSDPSKETRKKTQGNSTKLERGYLLSLVLLLASSVWLSANTTSEARLSLT